jgi:hypothetical protein
MPLGCRHMRISSGSGPCSHAVVASSGPAAGCLEVLQWLRAQDPPCPKPCPGPTLPLDAEECAQMAEVEVEEADVRDVEWIRQQA